MAHIKITSARAFDFVMVFNATTGIESLRSLSKLRAFKRIIIDFGSHVEDRVHKGILQIQTLIGGENSGLATESVRELDRYSQGKALIF